MIVATTPGQFAAQLTSSVERVDNAQCATNAIDPQRAKRHFIFACLAAVIAAVCVGGGIAFVLPRSQAAVATPAIPITNRIVPQAVSHIPLVDQNGQVTDMAAFHGRIVIMADFMTSCQEEYPITTGALLTVERKSCPAHLLDRVEIIEVTVDAWRDTRVASPVPTRVRGSLDDVDRIGRQPGPGLVVLRRLVPAVTSRTLPTTTDKPGVCIHSTSTTPTTSLCSIKRATNERYREGTQTSKGNFQRISPGCSTGRGAKISERMRNLGIGRRRTC